MTIPLGYPLKQYQQIYPKTYAKTIKQKLKASKIISLAYQ